MKLIYFVFKVPQIIYYDPCVVRFIEFQSTAVKIRETRAKSNKKKFYGIY